MPTSSARPDHPAPAPAAHPVVVIGAGPVGLAAAAHAHERGLPVVVLEAGDRIAASVRGWGHVRLFSPWRELVDPAAARLLASSGWGRPEPETCPTGGEWTSAYLEPLAAALGARPAVDVLTGHRVVGVARLGRDRVAGAGAEIGDVPLVVHAATTAGRRSFLARAVVDASGTWTGPNPLGGDGYPAAGEAEAADRTTYGIPDLADPAVAARYAGRHVAVAGSGASAHHVLVGLDRLAAEHPGTRVTWLVRRPGTDGSFGGGAADELAGRGALGDAARRAAGSAAVTTVTSFRTSEVRRDPTTGTLELRSSDRPDGTPGATVTGVDEVVVVTGSSPDRSWLRQVRLDLDGELDAPRRLAPEIHPAHHSCGSVSPHGADLLAQPEPGLYLAGATSYGRAPSFLAMTGFEQVRSILAEVAGDHEAAARVELVLPETGVCGGAGAFDDAPSSGCCVPTPA